MKNQISKEAIKFNAQYADIEAAAKLVKSILMKNVSFVKKLSKEAKKLYQWADKNCYDESNNYIKPIGGIKNLGAKMDMLDWLVGAYVELEDLAKSFDMKV